MAAGPHHQGGYGRLRRAMGRPYDVPPSQIHRRSNEVPVAELDAAVAQDVVGGGAVKIEIRQDMIEQQSLPAELALAGAHFEGDLLVLGTVDLARLEALDVVDGAGEAAR